jgi:hypothetical protein
VAEVEHLGNGICDPIERALPDTLPAQPVVLDEADDGTLVRDGAVHEVLPGQWGNHYEGKPWTITAPAECVRVAGVDARKRIRSRG